MNREGFPERVHDASKRQFLRASIPFVGPRILPQAANEGNRRYEQSVRMNRGFSALLTGILAVIAGSKIEWIRDIIDPYDKEVVPHKLQVDTREELERVSRHALFVDGIDDREATVKRLVGDDILNLRAKVEAITDRIRFNGSVKMSPEEFDSYDPVVIQATVVGEFLEIWGKHEALTRGTFLGQISDGLDFEDRDIIPRIGMDSMLSNYNYRGTSFGAEASIRLEAEPLIEDLKRTGEFAKVVNMSLQLGMGKLLIETKIPKEDGKGWENAERVNLRLVEPLSPLLGEKQLEENLSEYVKLADAFPDKLFIMAAGNKNSDIASAREKLEAKGEWPQNIILVGFVVKNSFDKGADSYSGGADVYTDEFLSSSEATAFVSALATLIYNEYPHLTPAEVKAYIYKHMTREFQYTRIPPTVGMGNYIGKSGPLHSESGMNEYVRYNGRIVDPSMISDLTVPVSSKK